MKKSDFRSLRSMLKKENRLFLFNHNPHILIVSPGRFALAYPVETYEHYIADHEIFPQKIEPGTGIQIETTGRGKRIHRTRKMIAADVYGETARAEIHRVLHANDNKYTPVKTKYAPDVLDAATKYDCDPYMVSETAKHLHITPKQAAEKMDRAAQKMEGKTVYAAA